MAAILSFPMFKKIFFFLFVITFFFSCSEFERKTEKELAQEKFGDIPLVDYKPSPNPDKNAYFGDLHVHTENSFDAYSFGTTASPSDAYKYAKGEAISTLLVIKFNYQDLWIFMQLRIMGYF